MTRQALLLSRIDWKQHQSVVNDQNSADTPSLGLSFCGCSWLMLYHIGVASQLYARGLLDRWRLTYLGTSSGGYV